MRNMYRKNINKRFMTVLKRPQILTGSTLSRNMIPNNRKKCNVSIKAKSYTLKAKTLPLSQSSNRLKIC